MKQFLLFLSGLILSAGLFANGYKIKFNLPQAGGKKIILAHYYLSNILVNDTILLDENGKGLIKGDTLLPQGLYKIFFDNNNHFDFLLSADQVFTISNPGFSNSSLEIKGAIESEEFINYTVFLSALQKQRKDYETKYADAPESEKEKYLVEINKLTKKLQEYWQQTAGKYPGTWLASFLMANYVPSPDSIPDRVNISDSARWRYKFDFQEEHYFDYFDITDERFLTTPLLKPKIENYFKKVLLQTFDSVSVGVINLIEESKASKPVFRYLTSYFLNESINSKIMGMDALFVEIAQNYYLSGEAFWADSATIEKIRENVIFAENNLIGKIAPELLLEGIEGERYYSLHQIDKKITILLIYEPGCSHCKTFVPELYNEVYLPFRDKGLEVYAIYSSGNHSEWSSFINKHNLTQWINVWDPHHNSGFKILYDARNTPGIYILGNDKKIIAKKLSVEQVKELAGIELGTER